MEKYKSMLIFQKYVVDKVIFERNNDFDFSQKAKIEFSINKKTDKTENKMIVNLNTKIFENAKENNYPFEMEVSITGFFEIENDSKEIDFEPNAIAILYPYIRAIVSTYTASANVSSLILPVINVNKLIEDQEEN